MNVRVVSDGLSPVGRPLIRRLNALFCLLFSSSIFSCTVMTTRGEGLAPFPLANSNHHARCSWICSIGKHEILRW